MFFLFVHIGIKETAWEQEEKERKDDGKMQASESKMHGEPTSTEGGKERREESKLKSNAKDTEMRENVKRREDEWPHQTNRQCFFFAYVRV